MIRTLATGASTRAPADHDRPRTTRDDATPAGAIEGAPMLAPDRV